MIGLNFVWIGLSAIVVGVVWRIGRSSAGNKGALFTAIALSFFLLFIPSSVVLLNAVFVVLAAGVCLAAKAKPRSLLIGSLIATAVAYSLDLYLIHRRLELRRTLREEYPLRSVADRLAYEVTSGNRAQRSEPVAIKPDVDSALTDQESFLIRDFRNQVLEILHDRKRDEFIRATGFGSVRMLRVQREYLELPEPKRIPLPQPPGLPVRKPGGTSEDQEPSGTLPPIASLRDDFFQLHRFGMFDFFDRKRLGYVRDRDHVAGFLPHAFSRIPNDKESVSEDSSMRKWRITRLELVSLLKHKEPVAYLSGNLPRMDDLKSARTRPLTEFETGALKKLRRDEDLVVDSAVDRIVMLGSLRAGKTCLQCHSVRRGELLGAFSYELFPETARKK